MPGETHTEEVVDLPLRQLRPREQLEQAVDLAAVRHLADEADPPVAGVGQEVGHDLEPFPFHAGGKRPIGPEQLIDGGQVGALGELLLLLQEAHGLQP